MSPARSRRKPDPAPARPSEFVRRAASLVVAVAVILGFVLRLRAADHEYLAQWDEAYHALVAKHMVAHPLVPTLYETPLLDYDYKSWTGNHVWLHKPPLTLWLMALSIAATGGERELAVRWPSLLLGTLSILLTYLIARELWGEAGRTAGAFAALLHAFNPLFIRLTSGTIPTDHVDLITVFFVELALLLYASSARKESPTLALAAGAALGAASLCKSLPALVPLAAALPLFWKGRERATAAAKLLAISLVAFAAAALPWPIYAARSWPDEFAWESSYTFQHLFTVVEGHDHPASFYLEMLPAHYGGIAAVAYVMVFSAVGWGVVTAWRRRDATLGAVAIWAILPYLVFSCTRTKLYAYVAPAVPAVLLLAGRGAASILGAWQRQRKLHRPMRLGLWSAALAVAALSALHVVPLAVERFVADYGLCPWNAVYDYPAFRQAMREIAAADGPKVLFNVAEGKAIQAMYYADCLAYAEVPPPAKVRELIEKGWRVYAFVDDQGSNLAQLRELERAGLVGQVRIVPIGPPRDAPRVHPYLN